MKLLESFDILKEINPIWYFNLCPDSKNFSTYYYNSKIIELSESQKKFIEKDERYSNNAAKEMDMGYQAWNKGIMMTADNVSCQDLLHNEKPDLNDNYIFLRKYFKRQTVYYFLFKRLISFNNPFKEISSYVKTKQVNRVDLLNPHCTYDDYLKYDSASVSSAPLVSVIIPTLNRYEYLKDVIEDLEKQDYKNFETIIIDQTDQADKKFYGKFKLKMEIVFQEGKGQWLARNEAIRRSKGDYLLFFDDDSRVDPDWITQHLKSLDFFKADISAGVSISKVGDTVPANYSFFRWADQFDSGNALVKREVFEKVGMFDRQFDKQRMGDGEFGLRAYLSGFRSISNPYAKRLHLKTGTGGLRQMGSWDAFRPKKFFSPRPLPSVTYLYRKYFPKNYVYNELLIGMLPSLIPYKWKGKKFLYPVSALLSIFILPVLLLQLRISWNRATIMLNEGDKIEHL